MPDECKNQEAKPSSVSLVEDQKFTRGGPLQGRKGLQKYLIFLPSEIYLDNERPHSDANEADLPIVVS